MPNLSDSSKAKLATCDQKLQDLVNKVAEHYGIVVVCGTRSKEEQEDAFHRGMSKVHFPNSKHNSLPSQAVDLAPAPIDWNDRQKFYHMIGFVQGVAFAMGIKIRCGADFNMDNNLKNDSFVDLPHVELVEENYASSK